MVRRLGVLLTALTLILTALASHGASAAQRTEWSRPQLDVSWPAAPVKDKELVARVSRLGGEAATVVLQVRRGAVFEEVARKTTSGDKVRFRVSLPFNRVQLRAIISYESGSLVSTGRESGPLPDMRVRSTSYAGKVVHPRNGQAVRVLFEGRRGHRVAVETRGAGGECQRLVLRGPSGKVARSPQRFWRLPRTGSYRLDLTPCWGGTYHRVDLQRWRLVDLEVDGGQERLRVRDGVIDVGVVRVPADERVSVRTTRSGLTWPRIVTPSGGVVRYFGYSPLVLDAGHGLRFPGGYPYGHTVTAGRYLLMPRETFRASASTALVSETTLNGPQVSVGDAGVAGRERGFTFAGSAGQLVHPETPFDISELGFGVELVDSSGVPVSDWQGDRGWYLPKDDHYTLYITQGNADAAAGAPVNLRLLVAKTLPEIGYDQAARFTSDVSGQWVVAPVTLPTSNVAPFSRRLTATGAAFNGAWQAQVSAPYTSRCSPEPNGPLGCGDNPVLTVDAGAPVQDGAIPAGHNIVVLRLAPGVTGSVDLRVGPGTS